MSMNVGGRKGAMANINITPYIDILLVLLIIFMVITPIRQMDLDVKVPQTSDNNNPNAAPDPNVIVVSVGEAAQIAVNQEPTTIADLGSKLQDIYSKRANKNMFVSASAKLPYGDVVKVIDIAKGAGVQDIGLLTEEIH
ncbi:MAG TPA: biopolymer transporter ExbD [Acidobacteriota bacterium]|nr:biopolymer transporter ExbD [Acidobacteriota bacterium]